MIIPTLPPFGSLAVLFSTVSCEPNEGKVELFKDFHATSALAGP